MASIYKARALAFVSILIAVAAFGLYWALNSRRVCLFKCCDEKGDIIMTGVNDDVSPCDDFQTYTCGKLFPLGMSAFDIIEQNLEKFEDKLLSDNEYSSDDLLISQLQSFYSQCFHDNSLHEDPDVIGITQTMLKNCYVNQNNLMDEGKIRLFSLEDLEYRSRYYGFTAQSLFSFYLDQDRKKTHTNAIYIGLPVSFFFQDRIHLLNIEQYKQFLSFSFKFGFPYTYKEMQDITTELAEYHYNLSMIVLGYRQRKVIYSKTTVERLQKSYSYFDWRRLFSKYFSEDVLKRVPIYLQHKGYFDDLEQIITNKQMTICYMLLNNIMEFMVYAIDFELNEDMQRISLAFINRKEFCKKLANKYFGSAITSYIIRKFLIRDPGQETLYTVVNYLKKSLKLYVMKARWFSMTLRKKIMKKIDKLETKLSVSSKAFSELIDEETRTIYYKRACGGGNIVDKVFCLNNFILFNNFRLVDNNITIYNKMVYSQTHKIMYDQVENALVVPTSMLQFSAFDNKWPLSVNFGAIGTVISKVLLSGILNTTLYNFTSKIKTCNDFLHNYVSDNKVNMSSVIEDLTGVKIAFRGYEIFLSTLWKYDATLKTLKNYSDNQLFFMSFASMFCSTKPVKYMTPTGVTYNQTLIHFINKTIFFRSEFNCDYSGNEYKKGNVCLFL